MCRPAMKASNLLTTVSHSVSVFVSFRKSGAIEQWSASSWTVVLIISFENLIFLNRHNRLMKISSTANIYFKSMTFPVGNYQAIVPRQKHPIEAFQWWLSQSDVAVLCLSMIIYILIFSQCDLTPALRIMSAILNAANSSFKVRKTTEDRI